jgi:hypothetical protein
MNDQTTLFYPLRIGWEALSEKNIYKQILRKTKKLLDYNRNSDLI